MDGCNIPFSYLHNITGDDLKLILSILLAFAILVPTLNKVWVMTDFIINFEYITENMCINKAKPEVMCSGVCYLSNQLLEVDNRQDNPLPTILLEQSDLVYFCLKVPVHLNAVLINDHDQNASFYYTDSIANGIETTPFRPPILS